MTEPKLKPHTPGSQVSTDPTDPTIYPTEGIEESSCDHGIANKADCTMCESEAAEKSEREAEEKAAQDKADEKL